MRNSCRILLSISFLIFPIKTFAAGFAVDAQSAAGLANSHAGETTGAHNISDSYANPAVLSDIKSAQLSVSASFIKVNIDDENSSGKFADNSPVLASQNHNAGVNAIVPAFYLASPLSKNLTGGISITSPFALATKYDQNWAGRYWALESQISTTNINPMLSYKITPDLAVAAGLGAQYIQARITNAVDLGALSSDFGAADAVGKAKGDDWGYGFNLGAKYKLDRLQIGVGYRSKIEHKIAGQVRVNSAFVDSKSNFTTPFTTPEIINFGLLYNLSDKAQLLYDTSWTRWSRIKTVDIEAENPQMHTRTKFNLRDSFRHSFGFNYQVNNKLQIRTGLAFEQGASGQYRNPRIPEADKTLVSTGLGYKLTQNWAADFTYMHQFYQKTKNNLPGDNSGVPAPSLQTEYEISVDVVALGIRYDF